MAGVHLQDLILETKGPSTQEQKVDCLKLLSVVIKNLGDEVKSLDPKYRQLRLSNEKVAKKIIPCPSAIDYLKAIGFQEVDDGEASKYLRIPDDKSVDLALMRSSLLELNNALDIVGGGQQKKQTVSASSSNITEEKKTPEGIIIQSSKKVSSKYPSTGKLSEKQKARLLMEKKRKQEAEDAKAARARNIAMLKQDKFVRENDENWKSGVSSACVKSGDGISTFRDKYGE
uniref:PUB domain-containing protein n=1 Tax=Leptocylindrus danicus TaxID=163516 RepID=A0A7S2PBQ1_9STRA